MNSTDESGTKQSEQHFTSGKIKIAMSINYLIISLKQSWRQSEDEQTGQQTQSHNTYYRNHKHIEQNADAQTVANCKHK